MEALTYAKQFDPAAAGRRDRPVHRTLGDRRDGEVYVYNDEVVLAVNVALATGRPLLLRGPSGAGKSTLARHVARVLRWRYYEFVVTSRTQARDLLWHFDALRRLNDAQVGEVAADVAEYLRPGPLWWAFDRESARRRGRPAAPPALDDPTPDHAESDRAVVLIDEIDKADPDVPNNLLVPLGSLEFEVTETETAVKAAGEEPPLLIITTNGERELPTAFLRRCVGLTLDAPGRERLVEIAEAHFGEDGGALYRRVADAVLALSAKPDGPAQASPAEYLDAIRACRSLGITPDDQGWEAVAGLTLTKPRS